ncbi:hypothetical protein [Flavobacterium sp.]|uniref:hypothetical protein n=1 Tax=Flavobacterium sp. TaxID=239 RepID=UPI0039E5197E
MKNFLQSSLYLVVFAAAGILFQISCSNSDDAPQQQLLNPAATGKVIYTKNNMSTIKIYTCNYDGSGETEIPIVLPAGIKIFDGASQHATPRISPDGQTIFFLAANASYQTFIYKANMDGSGLTSIVTDPNAQIEIGNVN